MSTDDWIGDRWGIGGETYSRFRRLLPRSRDPVLVVLKAHLLAEETLDRILHRSCRSERPLRDSRLMFHQKLKLCHALLGDACMQQWTFFERLNVIRNKLSHNLEVPNIDRRIDDAIDVLSTGDELAPFPGRAQRLTALKNEVACHCAVLEGFSEGLAVAQGARLDAARKKSARPRRASHPMRVKGGASGRGRHG